MLVLQANQEQEATFNRLIQTMGEQIVWDGRFFVRDNELILEGTVRSLIFQFETKKVLTNLVDIPVNEDQILDVSRHPTLKDLINMVLYAFGKWGTLHGLRVEQDYPQLNQLFGRILGMYYIEPSFRKENFRFYKVGVRITYEEVLQTALEYEKKQAEDPRAETRGLWHRLIWKNRERTFAKAETTLLERVEDRIGNNFYLVGYQCPKCSDKLHMAVYPDGKEVRIDTEENGVYLARVYTCNSCNCFYTPRPDRLISEGLIYEMDFGDDKKAYEDYLELLGYHGERAANFKFNEYEAVRKQRLQREKKEAAGQPKDPELLYSPQDALRQMEEFGRHFSSLPDEVLERFAHRVEEGFYPDAAVKKYEKKLLKEVKKRQEKKELEKETQQKEMRQKEVQEALWESTRQGSDSQSKDVQTRLYHEMELDEAGQAHNHEMELDETGQARYHEMELDEMGQARYHVDLNGTGREQHIETAHAGNTMQHRAAQNHIEQNRTEPNRTEPNRTVKFNAVEDTGYGAAKAVQNEEGRRLAEEAVRMPEEDGRRAYTQRREAVPKNPADEKLEKYQIRVGMLERLSDRQKKELKKQIQNDSLIDAASKQALLAKMEEAEYQELAETLAKKVQKSGNRSYAQLQKMIVEAKEADYPATLKEPYLEKLQQLQRQRGEEEVRQIMAQIPERMDRAGYRKLEETLHTYEGVDLSPYAETLQQKREAAEKQEIAGMVRRSRKVSRGDYIGLMRRLEEQEFADENVAPYMEKIKEKVHDLDEQRLEELLDGAQQMDFNAAAAVYEQIDGENFLPELKSSALEMLSKRLEKIRIDECELLVKKLQEEMRDKIKENARHHFYPARRVMLHTTDPGETSAIDAALAAYANERSMFEYPIFSVDTSRNQNGREGMVLTPENLFYSTKLHAYGIPVDGIASIEASTGLLNRKLTLEETNGALHKLPYAVKTSEMEDWAAILEDFVRYLQEKPASRKLKYLAKETHDTICCYRCGYVYHGRDVCPECGYKKNR